MSKTSKSTHQLKAVTPTTEQAHAIDVVRSGASMFLGGEAGVGKSWTLNTALDSLNQEQVVRLAPTGAAAMLIGGSTVHRFFGLGIGILEPGQVKRRISRYVRERVEKARTLVIDEVSMLRVDVMEAIEEICRECDPDKRPWGGKQLIATGDFAQLQPVIGRNEQEAMRSLFGDAVYAFEAQAWADASLQTVLLTIPQRQSDSLFIGALNVIRWRDEARLDSALATLNSRVRSLQPNEVATILTTRNADAEAINHDRLAALPGREHRYEARISGRVEKSDMPVPQEIRLKAGALVLMATNGKEYVNGSRGIVRKLLDDSIIVELDGGETVSVAKAKWSVIEYEVNHKTKALIPKVIGEYEQFPVRLGFAITVHRSQGMSLSRVHISADRWFSHGQVYVALSRATSLDGLTLEQPITADDIIVDQAVSTFMTRIRGGVAVPLLSEAPTANVKASKEPAVMLTLAPVPAVEVSATKVANAPCKAQQVMDGSAELTRSNDVLQRARALLVESATAAMASRSSASTGAGSRSVEETLRRARALLGKSS